MAHIDLVIGSTGAGKSTYARALAGQQGNVRFAIDEWMVALFGEDRPADAGFEWYTDRIARCKRVIWGQVAQLLAVDVGVVLEIGLTQRADRAALYADAERAGFEIRVHVLDAPVELRWARVEKRNRERGETFSLEVTRGMFDFVETLWEPPDAAELALRSGKVVTTEREGPRSIGG